jgi:glycerol-3-phosphate acyltransferase PlsY
MVATGGGVFFGVALLVALAAAAVWLVVFGLTRYASVASIAASASLPVWSVAFSYPPSVIVLSCAACVGIVFLHRANLRRLRSGTEHRVHLRPRRAAPQ